MAAANDAMVAVEDGQVFKVFGFDFVSFFATFIIGLGFHKSLRVVQDKINTTFLDSVTVGVFGSMALTTFLPELLEKEADFKANYLSPVFREIPIGMSIAFLGMVLMSLIDSIAHKMEWKNKENANKDQISGGRTMLIVVLTVHSFLEGIPIGVETRKFWTVATPLLVHKVVESTTVAASVMDVNNKTTIIRLMIYSAATPIGCTFGFLVSSFKGQVSDAITLILVGLSTVLIFFIAFVEMLPKVLHSQQMGYKKLLVVLITYILITSISVFSEKYFENKEPEKKRCS